VGAGTSDVLVGSHVLLQRLTGNSYCLSMLLDVSFVIREQMWFMHNSAPPDFNLTAPEFLDNMYPAQ